MKHPRLRWIVALFCAVLIAGCDWFEDPSPEQARISLDGTPGDMVEILLSTQFVTGITTEGTTQVELFDPVTLTRALPFDTVLNIRSQQRLFVRTIDADSVSSTVRMQVFIDGDRKYDEEESVNLRQLLFVFTFNQPVTSFIELI